MRPKKTPPGVALPLFLIVLLGAGSFFIQIIFNKGGSIPDCEYEEIIFPAEVLQVRSAGTGLNEVLFLLDTSGIMDTLAYSKEFDGYASDEQLKRKNIVAGEKFQYRVRRLLRGNCPSRVEALTMEKY